jgi:putative AlgH/UPF0301 family transcriptional regulator
VGIQLNNQLTNMTVKEVAVNQGMEWMINSTEPLYYGGSHNSSRVHVVHTPDWRGPTTVMINSEIAVTNDISILSAISAGEGPTQYRACAGHWIWDTEELERELNPRVRGVSHRWEITPASADVVFDLDGTDQWRQSLLESAHHSAQQWF